MGMYCATATLYNGENSSPLVECHCLLDFCDGLGRVQTLHAWTGRRCNPARERCCARTQPRRSATLWTDLRASPGAVQDGVAPEDRERTLQSGAALRGELVLQRAAKGRRRRRSIGQSLNVAWADHRRRPLSRPYAAVGHPAVRGEQHGRAQVLVLVPPVARARGRAARAENALVQTVLPDTRSAAPKPAPQCEPPLLAASPSGPSRSPDVRAWHGPPWTAGSPWSCR